MDEGDIDDMDLRADEEEEQSGDEYENETPAEKRLRLAKLYLESVKGSLAEGEFDAADIDKEIIASRLKQDVLEHSGKVHLFIADSFDFSSPPQATFTAKGHRLSVTSSTVSESAKHLFTAGKEGSIIQWDLLTGKKVNTFYKVKPSEEKQKGKGKAKAPVDPSVSGHTDEVYSLAISGDGKLLASAGADRRVGIWDVEKGAWIKGFCGHLGHKDAVSHVAFKKGTNQLYSSSFDRTVKVYDLTPGVMGYVETLFGHQDHILSLDALRGDVCVSVGARDKTVRYWKIVDETQLVFRGGGRSRIREVLEGGLKGDEEGDDMDVDGASKKGQQKSYIEGSLECVCMIDETTFVSGGDSGSLSLWSTTKKKPIFTQPLAHGLEETESSTEGIIRTPRWVTSLGCLRYSNIFASGSYDGSVRIWKLDPKLKSFSLAGTIPAPGIVNSLQLLSPPKEFTKHASWLTRDQNQSSNSPPPPQVPSPGPDNSTYSRSLLVVASLAKEHRFGRWLQQKEAKNTANVFYFSSRTSSS
ncbi:WD40 repeat-like protein [Coprinellus micaceus]|uniref:WD40 repeat-like protein n=1 Tax=Coprinellus micaceus TaxID=71717 RepID=A0A4Y7SY49_COPMI|nr:WD40 repeat-like protein [Coprinellus micaceus]